MIFVLSGNHRQYDSFCRSIGIDQFQAAVYLYSESQMRGRRGQLLIRVGTWRSAHRAASIETILEIANHLNWRIEDWDEQEDPIRLRARIHRSTQDLASSRSATS